MLPDEVYASSGDSRKFKYSHPLNHVPVDDGSIRARLAYDLMTFMRRSDCSYFINPHTGMNYDPEQSDDEVDIMIVDGFYKEAEHLVRQRLKRDPNCEKSQFQKAFIQNLKEEYAKLLARENEKLKSDPKNVNALLNKGFALANLNREREALDIANLALKIDPENLNVLTNKAYIAKLLGLDDLHQQTLAYAYNVRAKQRMALLEEQESMLLKDFETLLVEPSIDIVSPSAFEEFNTRSGASKSQMVH